MRRLAAIIVGFLPLLASAQAPEKFNAPERYKDQVAAMLKADQDNTPTSEGVLFAGSDTVAGWEVRRYFGQYRTTRRGIAGASIADSTFYADQLIVPFKPSTVVFDPGDNDLANGKTPEAVAADVARFVAKIHAALPKTVLVLMAIRPSPARISALDALHVANEKIKALVAQDKLTRFVDLDYLLGPDGNPDSSLLADDQRQLNKLGYDLLSQAARKEIQKAESRYWRGYDPVDGQ